MLKKSFLKGGPLTITDANLLLGRLFPEYFPKIFGKNQNESLDYEASKILFETLTLQVSFSFFKIKLFELVKKS